MKRDVQSREFYDSIADDYDDIVGHSSYVGELEPFLARNGGIRRALDVGAGTGHTVEGVLVWVRPETIVAVDASASMLEQLHAKFPRVHTVHADILDYLATDPEPFDLITAFSVFELLVDFETVVEALAAKLSPDGIFAFNYEPLLEDHPAQSRAETTYHDDDYGVNYTIYRRSPDDVLAWLARSGLRVLAQHERPNEYDRHGEGGVELRFIAAQRPR